MVQVRLNQTAAGPEGVRLAGTVIDVDKDKADDMIQRSLATPVREEPIERAVAEAPAETTSKRRGAQRAPRKVEPKNPPEEPSAEERPQ
jgi:hypothetical protein